jgi:hypothetical protein
MVKTIKYPLQAEETETLTALIEVVNPTNDDILKVRAYYKRRRDAEFPGWRQKYEDELASSDWQLKTMVGEHFQFVAQ